MRTLPNLCDKSGLCTFFFNKVSDNFALKNNYFICFSLSWTMWVSRINSIIHNWCRWRVLYRLNTWWLLTIPSNSHYIQCIPPAGSPLRRFNAASFGNDTKVSFYIKISYELYRKDNIFLSECETKLVKKREFLSINVSWLILEFTKVSVRVGLGQ